MPITKVWFSFSGRITRYDWWLKIVVPYFAANFVAAFFDRLFGGFDDEAGAGLLQSVFGLALLWPLLAGHAKRCHDRGRTA